MIVPDVNVLVALHRPQHSHHEAARQWWQDLRRQGDPLTVPDLIWVGFVRVVTNRRVFTAPTTPAEAWAFVEAVMTNGIFIRYAPHPGLMTVFGAQVRHARASGNLVTDAYIASTAISMGATVATFDRDFRKFDGLKVLELA